MAMVYAHMREVKVRKTVFFFLLFRLSLALQSHQRQFHIREITRFGHGEGDTAKMTERTRTSGARNYLRKRSRVSEA